MNLILANGHRNAEAYPLVRVWSEAAMIRRRERERIEVETILMQAVIASVVSGKSTALNKALKVLKNG